MGQSDGAHVRVPDNFLMSKITCTVSVYLQTSLLTRAVWKDQDGDVPAALGLYRQGLEHLIPALHCQFLLPAHAPYSFLFNFVFPNVCQDLYFFFTFNHYKTIEISIHFNYTLSYSFYFVRFAC